MFSLRKYCTGNSPPGTTIWMWLRFSCSEIEALNSKSISVHCYNCLLVPRQHALPGNFDNSPPSRRCLRSQEWKGLLAAGPRPELAVRSPLDIVRYADMEMVGLHHGSQRRDQLPMFVANGGLLHPKKKYLCFPCLATIGSDGDENSWEGIWRGSGLTSRSILLLLWVKDQWL